MWEILFFLSAFFLLAFIILVMRGLKVGSQDFLLGYLTRFDSALIISIERTRIFILQKKVIASHFIAKHIPEHSGALYAKFKHFKESSREHLTESLRGKQKLPHKGSASPFFWHLSQKNDSEEKE